MKLDFWQVTDDPIEKVVALIAKRALGEGERVLVVSADPEQRAAISRALWQAGPDSFLANGEADAPGAARTTTMSPAPSLRRRTGVGSRRGRGPTKGRGPRRVEGLRQSLR